MIDIKSYKVRKKPKTAKLEPFFTITVIAMSFFTNPTTSYASNHDEILGLYLCQLLDFDAQLIASKFSNVAASEQVKQAHSLSYPNLNLSTNLSGFESGILTNIETQTSSGNFTGSLGATIPIYRSGRNKAAQSAAKARLDASYLGTNALRQTLLQAGIDAYLDILLQDAVLTIQEANVSALTTQEKSSQGRFDIGSATRTDIDQALASLRNAEASLTTAQQINNIAKVNFKRLFGFEATDLTYPELNSLQISNSEELIKVALRTNPQLLQQDKLYEAAKDDVRISKGNRGPAIDFNLNYQQTSGLTGDIDDIDGATAGLTFTLPLYSGGALISQQRESQALASQQKALTLNLSRQITAQAQIAWENLLAAQERVSLVKDQQIAADKAFRGALEEQRLGRRATFEVLNIQNTLILSRLAAAQADIELIRAKIAIAELTGNIEALIPGMNQCSGE